MSFPSVPSPEAIIESFPSPSVTKIDGPPTYETLAVLKDVLKANAASMPTTRGGGTHVYLALSLSVASYATVDVTPFDVPIYPGPYAVYPNNPTGPQIASADRQHAVAMRDWREYVNVQAALKKQLTAAVDPIYLRAQRDRNT